MSDNTAIPRGLKATAVRAITQFDEDYHAKGGAAELEHSLSEVREGLAARIYRLALAARKEAKNLTEAQELFKAACAFAEARFKRQHEIVNVAQRIPAWAQFKSRILRAMRHGLDPLKFKSERMLREALRERLQKGDEAPATKEQGPQSPEAVEGWLETTGVHSAIRVTLARLVVATEYVKPRARSEAEAILADATARLSKLVDQRKIRSDATRDALEAARRAA
jgi:hypothetical protein